MVKRILLAALQVYWRLKFGRKITLTGRVHFGRHTRIMLSDGSKKGDIVVGDQVKLYGALISQAGGKIVIEDHAHIGPFTTVGAINKVHIKPYAMISSNVDIIDNNNHPVHPEDRRIMNSGPVNSPLKRWKYSRSSPIEIGANTWVGKNSMILKGVVLGANSVVGACSVVTRDVPANSIVAGNPAKVVMADISNAERFLC